MIPRRLNFICRRFGTLCLFHLHRQVGACTRTYLPMKMEQSVPERRHINFRRRGITQKKAYNIQYTAKVGNQDNLLFVYLFIKCKELYVYAPFNASKTDMGRSSIVPFIRKPRKCAVSLKSARNLEIIMVSSEYEKWWDSLFMYSLCRQLSLSQAEHCLIIR